MAVRSLDRLGAAIPLPRGLGHARYLTGVGQLPQADPTQADLAIDRARATAARAAGVGARLELGRTFLLEAQRGLGHQALSPSSSAALSASVASPALASVASPALASVASPLSDSLTS